MRDRENQMNKKISHKGMSLVEIMIVAGILGFLGLAVSTTFTDIFRMQSRIVGKDEANEFASAVGRFLYTESTCTSALQNTAFPVGGEANITLPGYVGYGGGTTAAPVHVGPGTMIGQKLRILTIKLADKNMPAATMTYAGQPVKRYLAQVSVSSESRVGSAWTVNVPRNFEFPVLLNSGNRIVKCMSGSSMEDVCTALGLVLEPSTGKCEPFKHCQYGGVYTVNRCDGNLSCTPKPGVNCSAVLVGDMAGCPPNEPNENTGDITCPSDFGAAKLTGTSTSSYSVSCGKKCTRDVAVVSEYFLCIKCPPP